MKRIIIIVVMGVLFLALYGFKLSLPTPNGDFQIRTGLLKQRQPSVETPKADAVVEEEES